MESNNINDLVDLCLQTVNLVTAKGKKPRSYGTQHKIYQSEIHTLRVIIKSPNTKAGLIAEQLSITNGALTQVVAKLLNKGLITSYYAPGNNKEIYYRPTELGKIADEHHQKYDEKLLREDFGFLKEMPKEEIKTVINFLKKLKKGLV